MMIEIKKMAERGAIDNFEIYQNYFENPRNFKKIYRSINVTDNMSDMQSVMSTNTKKSVMKSQYNYKKDRNSSHKKSTKSINNRMKRRNA